MEKILEYSFDDEPVSKFCYDIDNSRIEVYFKGYYDLTKDVYIERTCIWSIREWKYAKSKVGDEQRLCDLNKYMGIFKLILYMKYNDANELELLVNTIDNRYITLYFKEPKIYLK